MRTLGAVTLVALLLGGIVACESGGTTVAGGGTGGTGSVAYGTVTELGSIWVNGVKWETRGANIRLNGEKHVGDDNKGGGHIEEGMVVAVEGERSDPAAGLAETITYRSTLIGTVESVGTDNLVVLGQTVRFEPGLTFTAGGAAPASIGELGLARGEWVEISGLLDENGEIRARYIIRPEKTPESHFIRGYIESVGTMSFKIGSLTVTPPYLARFLPGDFVEVSGSLYGNDLVATTVERQSSELGNIQDAEDFEAEGLVKNVDQAIGELTLAGYTVRWDASTTEFEGGLESSLAPGIRIEVEGTLAGGIVRADSVKFGDAIELEGVVATADGSTLTLAGLPALHIDIQYESRVDLSVGRKVSVRARTSGARIIATHIEVSDEVTDSVGVQGPFDLASSSVLDIPLDDTVDGYYLNEEQPVTRSEFIAAIDDGDLVELEGTLTSGNTVDWVRAETE